MSRPPDYLSSSRAFVFFLTSPSRKQSTNGGYPIQITLTMTDGSEIEVLQDSFYDADLAVTKNGETLYYYVDEEALKPLETLAEPWLESDEQEEHGFDGDTPLE